MIITEKNRKIFEELSEPLVKFLNDTCHPHVTIIITQTSIELLEGICASPITKYVKD
jgi:hypothetical protein